MEMSPVRSAADADQPSVINVIVLAFSTDPVARWANPDPSVYLTVMPDVVQAFGGNGFEHNSVYMAGEGRGAAMWLPPGIGPDEERLMGLIESNAPPPIVSDLMQVMEAMGSSHPDEPHWYLPLIGVDPAFHGHGIGSALMSHALKRADEDGLPAYLESSNPRNIPLYERHGFEIIRTIQIGSSPPVVPMLRRPKNRG